MLLSLQKRTLQNLDIIRNATWSYWRGNRSRQVWQGVHTHWEEDRLAATQVTSHRGGGGWRTPNLSGTGDQKSEARKPWMWKRLGEAQKGKSQRGDLQTIYPHPWRIPKPPCTNNSQSSSAIQKKSEPRLEFPPWRSSSVKRSRQALLWSSCAQRRGDREVYK